MAVPTTLTAVAGAKITATAFNAGVRDPIDFLLDPPLLSAFDNTGIVCGDGAEVLLALSGETYDTDTMHDTATNNSRIIFTTAGTYRVSCTIQWPSATYTSTAIHARLNSGGSAAGGTQLRQQFYGSARVPQMHFTRTFTAGQYIEFFISQTSGGSRTTTAGALATYVEALRVAA